MEPLAPPPTTATRRQLAEEVIVVLSLSLLASAASAILSLFEAPIAGQTVASVSQSPLFGRQLIGFVFGLAPALLVVHLLRRSGEGIEAIGLGLRRPWRDVAEGVGLFAAIGLAGLALYLGAVEIGANRAVIPAPPPGHWWTYPVVVLHAVEAALVEEIIVLGYLVTRLQQMGSSNGVAIATSGVLRGAYHLYQGWGGFGGNLVMGLVFGWLFVRTRRTWPFVVAHLLLDVAAAVGWLAFGDRLPGS
jgi:membrane protease YdiL (CAAX protease family)